MITPPGLIAHPSSYGPKETMDRLIGAVEGQGMSVFARIDHAAAAESAGLLLRPTEVLIFGSPRGGTLLMQVAQTSGIDLPLRALVWQNEAGETWLSYNDPTYLAERHHADDRAGPILATMTTALVKIAHEATGI
jgi:uncharacterized protein (DUF302 family)